MTIPCSIATLLDRSTDWTSHGSFDRALQRRVAASQNLAIPQVWGSVAPRRFDTIDGPFEVAVAMVAWHRDPVRLRWCRDELYGRLRLEFG